jgi:signal transduction histidine kinase/ligand-binding sensor domain-containing protein
MGRGIILLLLLINAHFSSAQSFTFVNYSKEGLNPQLLDIAEDDNGSLWMTGFHGQFYSFDGTEAKTYSFPDNLFTNNIFRVVTEGSEKVWFLTDLGLVAFDGESFKLVSIDSELEFDYSSQIGVDGNNRIWIVDKKGTLFFIEKGSLRYYTCQSCQRPYQIRSIVSDHENNIWLSTDSFLIRIDKSLHESIVSMPILPEENIQAFDISQNKIAIATQNRLITIADSSVSIDFTTPADLRVKQMILDSDNNKWMLTHDNELWVVQQQVIKRVNQSSGLTDNKVLRIFADKNRNVWILTDAKGTFKCSKQPFVRIEVVDEPIISSILVINDSTVLLGTYGKGIYLKSGQKTEKIITNSNIDRSLVLGLKYCDKKTIAVATNGNGLFFIKDIGNGLLKKIRTFKPGQPASTSRSRCIQIEGDSILLGSANGLSVFISERFSHMALDSTVVNCIQKISAAKFLVGTHGEGLIVQDSLEKTKIDSAYFKSTSINVIKADPYGNYWVGSNKEKIKIYNSKAHLVGALSLPLEYQGAGVFVIEFLDEQNALIGLDEFIVKISFNKNYELLAHKVYGPSHGWTDPDLVLGASIKDKNGNVWIGTTTGAFRFDRNNDSNTTSVPVSYLRKIQLFGATENINSYAQGKKGLSRIPDKLSLPYNLNSVVIGFRASELNSPRSVVYRFRLLGLSAEWSEWTHQDEIIYSNLSYGKYDFEVQAKSHLGELGRTSIYTFTIRPAFWQTWGFYILLSFAILIVFFLSNRLYHVYKLEQYKKQEELKKQEAIRIKQQMSMDFHDELGNKLAGVMSYASALKLNNRNFELVPVLEYIENSAQEIYYKTKDFIWSIDVQSNNLLEVLIYLRDFGVKFFERHNIEFEIPTDFDEIKFNRPLPEGYNRHIILIFKEAMTNIFKHAQSTRVQLYVLNTKENEIEIAVEDNGIGEANFFKTGSGIRNMERRAEKIDGTLALQKSELGGMKVSLTFESKDILYER